MSERKSYKHVFLLLITFYFVILFRGHSSSSWCLGWVRLLMVGLSGLTFTNNLLKILKDDYKANCRIWALDNQALVLKGHIIMIIASIYNHHVSKNKVPKG